MGNEVTIEITAPRELGDLRAAVDKKKPDPGDVAEYGKALDAHPAVALALSDVAGWVQQGIVKALGTVPKSVEMALRQRPALMRAELGYNEATPLERLLIDHVVACWLRQQQAEMLYTEKWKGSLSTEAADFWERRLSAAQRRYLRACETLTRVRRLVRATVQINIAAEGGQQVNVAGGLEVKRNGKGKDTES